MSVQMVEILNPHAFPRGCRVTDVPLHAGIAVGGSTVQSSEWWCNPPHTHLQYTVQKYATVEVFFYQNEFNTQTQGA